MRINIVKTDDGQFTASIDTIVGDKLQGKHTAIPKETPAEAVSVLFRYLAIKYGRDWFEKAADSGTPREYVCLISNTRGDHQSAIVTNPDTFGERDIYLRLPGYGLCGADDDVDDIIAVRIDRDANVKLLVWADINNETATHVIDLSGAKLENRGKTTETQLAALTKAETRTPVDFRQIVLGAKAWCPQLGYCELHDERHSDHGKWWVAAKSDETHQTRCFTPYGLASVDDAHPSLWLLNGNVFIDSMEDVPASLLRLPSMHMDSPVWCRHDSDDQYLPYCFHSWSSAPGEMYVWNRGLNSHTAKIDLVERLTVFKDWSLVNPADNNGVAVRYRAHCDEQESVPCSVPKGRMRPGVYATENGETLAVD
jgi:hypothetical protein